MVILVIVLVLFGARRVPEIGASIGKGIREFKKNISDVDREVREPIRDRCAPTTVSAPASRRSTRARGGAGASGAEALDLSSERRDRRAYCTESERAGHRVARPSSFPPSYGRRARAIRSASLRRVAALICLRRSSTLAAFRMSCRNIWIFCWRSCCRRLALLRLLLRRPRRAVGQRRACRRGARNTPSSVLTGWLTAPDRQRERRADRLVELAEPRNDRRRARTSASVSTFLPACCAAASSVLAAAAAASFCASGMSLSICALRGDAGANLFLHVLELRLAAFVQRVEPREVVAVVVVEQLARLADLRAAERPCARPGNDLAVDVGDLTFERLHASNTEN